MNQKRRALDLAEIRSLDEYGVGEDFTPAAKNVSELIRQEQFNRKSLTSIKEQQLFRSLLD